jgi:hypothetical protein
MDVTALSDVQLDHLLGQIGADPFNEDYDSVEALRREKRRRLAARSQAPANVERNLEASSSPIAMEPVAGDGLRPKPTRGLRPKPTREQMDEALIYGNVLPNGQPAGPGGGIGIRNTPEDLAIYAQVVGDANRRETERMKARVDARMAARAAPRSVATPDATAPDTVMVNGVQVPVRMLDGAGRPMTTIGDERRAMEAAREAEIADRVSREAQEDLARYGTKQRVAYVYDNDGNITRGRDGQPVTQNLTPITPLVSDVEQFNNLMERRDIEARQAQQNRALSSRPGLRQLASDARDRRRLIANRAMLAGGSSGLRGGPGGNMGMFTALAMLNGVDPESIDAQEQALMQMLPINADRAKIEAAQNAQLTELGLRTAQGRGFQQPTGAAERLGNAQAAAAERAAEPEVAAIADISEGVYTSPEARAHLTAIGKQYDTNWFGGAGEDRKPELVQRLTQPPYSLTPERASEAADIALGTTRWWNRPF